MSANVLDRASWDRGVKQGQVIKGHQGQQGKLWGAMRRNFFYKESIVLQTEQYILYFYFKY